MGHVDQLDPDRATVPLHHLGPQRMGQRENPDGGGSDPECGRALKPEVLNKNDFNGKSLHLFFCIRQSRIEENSAYRKNKVTSGCTDLEP